ncbi:DUF2637 domain-containing protein [Amycolatopsis pithecellobii]|uniref:DUF2637 domain-containing protein n=1 Tax=Amycolatopsis pithecellobii TaxID=664692 RepID=UPI00140BCEE7|nr:DUF2637 domain-containing protein [Amycolatopsis pithecellobii]
MAVATGAAVLSFTSLTDLAIVCGTHRNLAWLFPVALDAAAVVATRVWLARVSSEVVVEARRIAVGTLVLSVLGNATDHYLRAYQVVPPWWLVAVVAMVPPVVLVTTVHLVAAMVSDRQAVTAPDAATVGQSPMVELDQGQDEKGTAICRTPGGEQPVGLDQAEPGSGTRQSPVPAAPQAAGKHPDTEKPVVGVDLRKHDGPPGKPQFSAPSADGRDAEVAEAPTNSTPAAPDRQEPEDEKGTEAIRTPGGDRSDTPTGRPPETLTEARPVDVEEARPVGPTDANGVGSIDALGGAQSVGPVGATDARPVAPLKPRPVGGAKPRPRPDRSRRKKSTGRADRSDDELLDQLREMPRPVGGELPSRTAVMKALSVGSGRASRLLDRLQPQPSEAGADQ